MYCVQTLNPQSGKAVVCSYDRMLLISDDLQFVVMFLHITLCQYRCVQPLWMCIHRPETVVSAYSVSGSQSNIL